MSTLIIHAVLFLFVVSYFIAGWSFSHEQKLGHGFVVSFDKSFARGAISFILGAGLAVTIGVIGGGPYGLI